MPLVSTALMLTQHTYFNLDAFANPMTDLIWNHTYSTPFSKRILEPDASMVPTGKLTTIPQGDINDFWSKPKEIGASIKTPGWVGNCGTSNGCEGYNNCWIVDKSPSLDRPVATLSSAWSGIKLDIYSNQGAVQLYTCYYMNGVLLYSFGMIIGTFANCFVGEIAIKKTQGGYGSATNGFVKSGGCLALEAQDWNDGINQ